MQWVNADGVKGVRTTAVNRGGRHTLAKSFASCPLVLIVVSAPNVSHTPMRF
jgi:hypothetical protein